MIISLNWLKKFTDIDMPVDELATLIGARLVEIEEVIDIGAKYKDVLVVRVVETSHLEGSDHLNILKIDDGGKSDCERDANGLIQVVCGAPNVRSGQMVAWLKPGVIVPDTFYGYKPLVLEARKLQGAMSNGMIASPRELDLFDEHDGILVIDKDVSPGASFADAYELDDHLFDIENKSLTHRPDTFGIIGFAREVAAITGKSFKTPEWLADISPAFQDVQKDEVNLTVSIDDLELSSRYLAIVMSDADGNKKSPLQIQTYLSRVGVRPINAVVDVTNYLMILTGQPLHAFDYDKLVKVSGGKADIHVRAGREDEELALLDGRIIKLTSGDIVISAGETAIGLAGAMGGANTAIDSDTKNIIIESATFNLYNLRATQMRHGIFSEAITRFTKGQPADLTAPVLFDAVRLMNEWAGAKCVSNLAESYPGKHDPITLDIETKRINNILGSEFRDEDISRTLGDAEFTIENIEPGLMKLGVPYWRSDIHISEDISEEVGRLNGFDNIEPVLPKRDFTAVKQSDYDDFRSTVRKTLSRAGANEALTYSFIHGSTMQKAGHDVANSYRIINSISPNLQYYRQTLTPNLIDLVHPNIKQGYDSFAIFELNKSHSKLEGLSIEDVPVESDMTALVVTNKNNQPGAPYYQAKRILDHLCESLGLVAVYEPFEKELNTPLFAPFEHRRSARVTDVATGSLIGIVGEYKKSVTRGFKLPEYTSGFEINTQVLFDTSRGLGNMYSPISRYPSSDRDICFKVDNQILYSQIIDAAKKALESCGLETAILPIDIYQPDNGATKNITIRIRLTSHDRTLTGDEVNTVIESLISSVITATKATVI